MGLAYFKQYPGDFMRDTGHLSLTEYGAYSCLLNNYYAAEKPLTTDLKALYRLCRAVTKMERQAVEKVIREFFTVDGDVYRNKRADKELGFNSCFSKDQSRKALLRQAKIREEREAKNGCHGSATAVPPDVPRQCPPRPRPCSDTLPMNHEGDSKGGIMGMDHGECSIHFTDTDGKNCEVLKRPEDSVPVKLEGYPDFCRFDVTSIACNLLKTKTGGNAGYFSVALKATVRKVGEVEACNQFREMLYSFWNDMQKGEVPRSVSAALTARVKKLVGVK